jgi:hypothetical protein
MSGDNEPMYVIRVEFPLRVAKEIRDRIGDAVIDAAFEAEPDDRDGWDIFCSGAPELLEPCDTCGRTDR